ncbi:MAG: VOC family protein, partial [Myxococcales bacterium]|nr:VOC family protein [Myxococcales bacterium]
MEPRISLVTLGVRDLARSRAFYERLGWKVGGPSNESVTFFQAGGMILGLHGLDALAEDAGHRGPVAAPGTFGGIALAHNARTNDDVARVLAEAERAGATIVKPAQDVFWGGHSGYFADPDGHL